MIIQEKVEVKITNRNRSYYRNLNYEVNNNILNVYVKDLPNGSNVYVRVSCDICHLESNVSLYNYKTCFGRYNLYTCKPCSIENKTKKTNISKYGVSTPLKNLDILNKVKETNISKYGHSCVLLSDKVRNKTKETNLKKYGVEFGTQSDKAKNKRKETNLKKYGVDNIFKSEIFKKNIRLLRILNGDIVGDDLIFEWKIYKNDVRRITRSFKEELFNNWNGLDYYDFEFIKLNLKLHHNNKNFPTIDHKVSFFEGFLKKIEADKIGDISNLVITKRSINSKKNKF